MKCIGFTCGDCIGFPLEFFGKEYRKSLAVGYEPFKCGSHFTDDTVMTIARMKWLLSGDLSSENLVKYVVEYGNKYPLAGYGANFKDWLQGSNGYKPYNSWGNGSAMAISPIGWFFNTEEDVLKYAEVSAAITHDHPEGIKGAQAIAICVYLARTGHTKEEIKEYVENKFGYDLNRTLDEIRPNYVFHVSCQKSVPESIISFLEANSTKEAIQNAISLAGDTDTQADMAGAIAEAFYNDADELFEQTIKQVDGEYPDEFVDIIKQFNEKLNEGNTNTSNEISW
jgi:ADP-ribosylglycohydrolase